MVSYRENILYMDEVKHILKHVSQSEKHGITVFATPVYVTRASVPGTMRCKFITLIRYADTCCLIVDYFSLILGCNFFYSDSFPRTTSSI